MGKGRRVRKNRQRRLARSKSKAYQGVSPEDPAAVDKKEVESLLASQQLNPEKLSKLEEMGEAAVPFLAKKIPQVTYHPHWLALVKVLERIDEAKAVAVVCSCLQEGRDSQEFALIRLKEIYEEKAIDQVIEALPNLYGWTRVLAIEFLGSFRNDSAAVAALSNIFKNDHEKKFRKLAALYLPKKESWWQRIKILGRT